MRSQNCRSPFTANNQQTALDCRSPLYANKEATENNKTLPQHGATSNNGSISSSTPSQKTPWCNSTRHKIVPPADHNHEILTRYRPAAGKAFVLCSQHNRTQLLTPIHQTPRVPTLSASNDQEEPPTSLTARHHRGVYLQHQLLSNSSSAAHTSFNHFRSGVYNLEGLAGWQYQHTQGSGYDMTASLHDPESWEHNVQFKNIARTQNGPQSDATSTAKYMLHAADTMVGTDHVGCMTLQPDKVYLDKSLQRITGQPCFAAKPDFHGLAPEFLAAYDVKGSQFANFTVIDKGQHIRGAPSVRLLQPTSAKDG